MQETGCRILGGTPVRGGPWPTPAPPESATVSKYWELRPTRPSIKLIILNWKRTGKLIARPGEPSKRNSVDVSVLHDVISVPKQRVFRILLGCICYSECVKSGNVYISWNFQGIYTFPDSFRDCIYSLIFWGNLHIPWKIELIFWHIPWKCYFKQAS